jgi:uncharacterized membrane protein
MKNRILKVVTWRCISIATTLAVIYGMTGDVKAATSITVFLHALLTGGHFGFEILWERFYEDKDR